MGMNDIETITMQALMRLFEVALISTVSLDLMGFGQIKALRQT